MSRERRFAKVTSPYLESTGRIPNLSIDVVECKRNHVATRVDLNLGKGGEGKVGWGT